ncbi:metallophosphoesterase [Herbaspirillum huttiense]|uniref:metallophosphoesterase n=1 Tax=Herbaspirillum huttiense TaxID=863372 RepID=UPI0031D69CCC
MSEGHVLRFIHLSDIHFSNKAANIGFDPDKALRNRLRNDIAAQREKLGSATAILVSGDLAYAGKREEYENAALWLDELCDAAGCDTDAVLMCPGNHDVDQSVIRANQLIQDGHEAVRRGADFYSMNQALLQRLTQPDARQLFYASFAAYNDFAARYECSVFADQNSFAWEHDFELNDGSSLRIRGMNSALLSGLFDNKGSLFLGDRAWSLDSQAGIEYLVMAHHPPAWLADGSETERSLDGGAKIHLFGHEHDQRVVPGRDWMKLYAGAVNPHRAEPNWRPGYNIVEVSIELHGGVRFMNVDVHAREWQGTPPQFRAHEDINQNPVFNVKIKLAALPPGFRLKPQEPHHAPKVSDVVTAIESEKEIVDERHQFRKLSYRFFKLSLSKKNEIVGHLRLVEEEDGSLPSVESFKRSLARAKDRNQLDELFAWIEKLEKE